MVERQVPQSVSEKSRVCLLPFLTGVGGPTSFYLKMKSSLLQRGFGVVADPLSEGCDVVLLIGSISRLDKLWKIRQRGIKIVQRLNGMNWVHKQSYTGWRHYLRSERNNFILSTARRYLANRIVYQSKFSHDWWNRVYGRINSPESVAHNGVDLSVFTPGKGVTIPDDFIRILIVEGKMGGGHQYGISYGYALCQYIHQRTAREVEMVVVGEVPQEEALRWKGESGLRVRWMGVVPREDIPDLDRSAHVMYTAEINAACPNSVIEAMACGLPVVGFDTGSIAELLGGKAGIAVPYGSNHWKLEAPDIPALGEAALKVMEHREEYSRNSHQRAVDLFGVERMVDLYLEALLG